MVLDSNTLNWGSGVNDGFRLGFRGGFKLRRDLGWGGFKL